MWWTRALTPFRRWRGQLRVEKSHQDLEKRNINMPMAEAGPHRRHMIRPARIPRKEGTTTTRSTFPNHLGAPLPYLTLPTLPCLRWVLRSTLHREPAGRHGPHISTLSTYV